MNTKSQPKPSCRPASEAKRCGKRSGNAIVEVSLLVPWIFFLFVGVLDVGFYNYALMAVGNAARVAVLQTSAAASSADNLAAACSAAMNELQSLPNVYGKSVCAASAGSVTQATPVYADAKVGPRLAPDISSIVTITYASVPVIPIPGIIPVQMTIVRTAEMRVGK